jgi:hypothetical protein
VIEAGGARVTEAYEQLRRHVVAGFPAGGSFGLALLLREGVTAWIERCVSVVPSPLLARPGEPSPLILIPPLQAGIVQILASIALSWTQEIHS